MAELDQASGIHVSPVIEDETSAEESDFARLKTRLKEISASDADAITQLKLQFELALSPTNSELLISPTQCLIAALEQQRAVEQAAIQAGVALFLGENNDNAALDTSILVKDVEQEAARWGFNTYENYTQSPRIKTFIRLLLSFTTQTGPISEISTNLLNTLWGNKGISFFNNDVELGLAVITHLQSKNLVEKGSQIQFLVYKSGLDAGIINEKRVGYRIQQHCELDTNGKIITTEEFWMALAREDTDTLWKIRSALNQNPYVEIPHTREVFLWLQLNETYRLYGTNENEVLATPYGVTEQTGITLKTDERNHYYLSTPISFWQQHPWVWQANRSGGMVKLEIPAEQEEWFELAKTFFAEQPLEAEKFSELAKIPLPLSKETLAQVESVVPLQPHRIALCFTKFPSYFTDSLRAEVLRGERPDVSVHQLALATLLQSLPTSDSDRSTFLQQLMDHVIESSMDPLVVVLDTPPHILVDQGFGGRFGNRGEALDNLVQTGKIVVRSPEQHPLRSKEMMAMIRNGTADWSAIVTQVTEQYAMPGRSLTDHGKFLASIKDVPHIAEQPELQAMYRAIAQQLEQSKALISIDPHTQTLTYEAKTISDANRLTELQEALLPDLAPGWSVKLSFQRSDFRDTLEPLDFPTWQEIRMVMDTVTGVTDLTLRTRCVNILSQSRQAETNTYTLPSALIAEQLAINPLIMLALVDASTRNQSIIVELPPWFDHTKYRTIASDLKALQLSETAIDYVLQKFFAKITDNDTFRQQYEAGTLTAHDCFLELYQESYQAMVNASYSTDKSEEEDQAGPDPSSTLDRLIAIITTIASQNRTDPGNELKPPHLHEVSSYFTDEIVQKIENRSDVKLTFFEKVIADVNETGVVIDPQALITALSEYSNDKKRVYLSFLKDLVRNESKAPHANALNDALIVLGAAFDLLAGHYISESLLKIFEANISTPENFLSLFQMKNGRLTATSTAFNLIASKMIETSDDLTAISALHRSGLFVVEVSQFEGEADFFFWQTALDYPGLVFQDVASIKLFLQAVSEKTDVSVVMKNQPIFIKKLAYFVKDRIFGRKELFELLHQYMSQTEILHSLVEGVGRPAAEAEQMAQLLTNRQGDVTENLISLLKFYTDSSFAPLHERIVTLVLHGPNLIFTESGQSILKTHIEKFSAATTETALEKTISLIYRIMESSSITVRQLSVDLIDALFQHENPEEILSVIENIFSVNPQYVATTVEMILYTRIIHSLRNSSENLLKFSPLFKEMPERRKMMWITLSILRNHLASDSRWLKIFVEQADAAKPLLHSYAKGETLDPAAETQLKNTLVGLILMKRIREVVHEATTDLNFLTDLKSTTEASIPELLQLLNSQSDALRETAQVDALYDAYAQENLGLLGITNWQDIKNYGEQRIQRATERNQALTSLRQLDGSKLYIKSFRSHFFADAIAEYGFQAKEFFKLQGDATPGDVDAYQIDVFDQNRTLLPEGGYGDVLAVFKDEGQYVTANDDERQQRQQLKSVIRNKVEVFKTGVLGQEHVGFAVGVPITEVSAFVLANGYDIATYRNMVFSLARKNLYIPIFTSNDTCIFTYEQFQQARQRFEGMAEFSDESQRWQEQGTESYSPQLNEITQQKFEAAPGAKNEVELMREANQLVISRVTEAIQAAGLYIDTDQSLTQLGTLILNTGSTGRSTNSPHDTDLDLMVMIDQSQWDTKAAPLYAALRQSFSSAKDESHQDHVNNYFLVDLGGVTLPNGVVVDLDISVQLKSSYIHPASHEAVEQKLDSLKATHGEAAYQEVVATIIYTKQLLKKYNAYKDGLKGIGTENWILAHQGNLKEACREFAQIVFKTSQPTEDAQAVTHEEFRRQAILLDPGYNIKFNGYDNYYAKISISAYQGMCQLVKDVLHNKI